MIPTGPVEGSVMQFKSGRYFDILKPWDEPDILVDDLAHSLSNLCRYTGHSARNYTVAEHSVWCSYLVPEEEAFDALMHDTAEMITGDIASPFKFCLGDTYKKLEKPINERLALQFDLHYPWSQAVRDADLAMLAAERRQLMMPIGEWKCLTGVVPAPIAVECWEPWHAKEKFLSRLRALAYRRGLHIPLLVRNI